MDSDRLETFKVMAGISAETTNTLVDCQADIAAALDTALEEFYVKVAKLPVAGFFAGPGQMDAARSKQAEHWATITAGTFDRTFVENAQRIGTVHARIDLEMPMYVTAYSAILDTAIRELIPDQVKGRWGVTFDLSRIRALCRALVQSALFDMAIVSDVYLQKKEEERAAAEQSRQELENAQTDALKKLAGVLSAMSSKDLTCAMPDDMTGAFAAMARDTNNAIGALSAMIQQNIRGAVDVQTTTRRVSEATSDLASRTEQQAVSLEETAATMQQITVGIRHSSEKARVAADFSKRSRVESERGETALAEALASMSEITRSSEEINAIVSLIDGVAFQTNLLALNASVEAARAGDAGRGFAVVAQEVRALAQRCSSAAEDITVLVKNSNELIRGGVERVEQVGRALSTIRNEIVQVDTAVEEIATIATSQASNLGEVDTAVSDLDRITQQNAAMADVTHHDIDRLLKQVDTLVDSLNEFSVGAGPRATVAPMALSA